MAGLATLALVWLGAQKPEGRVKAALDEWAAAHGVMLEAPRAEPSDDGEAARALAERCDRDLDQARDQANGGDDGAARQTLARLEQTLRDHAELLQASWLMAERYRLEAQIASRSSESADRWQERADVLEGERAASFGDDPGKSPTGEARRAPAPIAKVPVVVTVHGARKHETYWDGTKTEDQVSVARGEHHLAIVRGKRVVWTGWVSVLLPAALDVWIPDAPPCSLEDFEGAAFTEAEARVPKGVRCGAWVAAAPGPKRGTIRAAICERETCRRPSTWAYEVFAPAAHAPDAKKGLPIWATWTLAGVGVAAAASVILWQAGAFDRKEAPQRVVYDGTNL
jgi:hypothetical protein